MTEATKASGPHLSPWWRHATVLVMIAGFSVLSMITVLTYTNAPPIPARVTDTAGATLFDKQAILHGQEVFLKYGLMEHGTLWGHGAYLGPDYTAEYLHRLGEICRSGSGDEGAAAIELKRNRYDASDRDTRLQHLRGAVSGDPGAGMGPVFPRARLPRPGSRRRSSRTRRRWRR